MWFNWPPTVAQQRVLHFAGVEKMRHLEIRYLWLQKEVAEGKVVVSIIWGKDNPADFMTKILGLADVESRFKETWILLIE